MAIVTQSLPRHTVGIIGGGISGLSAAYYINRKFGPAVQPIILESSSRSGGWIRSIKHENNLYEMGPRTIRPAGVQGMNTLDLVEELGLHSSVVYVPWDHPAAKNRLLYLDDKLVRIPTEKNILFSKVPPFKEPLLKILLREIFKPRKIAPDESLHSFVARRFDPYLADTLVDPMIRGITAGDARKISVKFLASALYGLEQKYGSVVLGNLISTIRKEKSFDPWSTLPGYKSIPKSDIAVTAGQEKWSVWSLEPGLEALALKLEEKILEGGGKILKNAPVHSIVYDSTTRENGIEYLDPGTGGMEKISCSHIISAAPSFSLSGILKANKNIGIHVTELTELLDSTPAMDVTVTNLKYQEYFDKQAFGFLVPSKEINASGLLGIVFNTCAFPQGSDVIITVMSQGIDLNLIQGYVQRILGLRTPKHVIQEDMKQCIPQYIVGHYERLAKARKIIRENNIPITLAGASYDGVSVNDCIMSGRRAAEELPLDVTSAT